MLPCIDNFYVLILLSFSLLFPLDHDHLANLRVNLLLEQVLLLEVFDYLVDGFFFSLEEDVLLDYLGTFSSLRHRPLRQLVKEGFGLFNNAIVLWRQVRIFINREGVLLRIGSLLPGRNSVVLFVRGSEHVVASH